MAHKPLQIYLKVVDTQALDSPGRPRLIPSAKWNLSMPEERGPRFPPWHEKFYLHLNTLGTRPGYRKRGAGSMLVKRRCDLADLSRINAYMDASQAGVLLYQNFGFADRSESRSEEHLIVSMARS
ncbi:hypothetical protein N7539_008997 [Penicillium diatomitis]|uniref:N-acetyltransferase domain-containing protein n=1 Tax=Penicillium diatomitis TaxID=2819901 RepID=A0A9W9WKV8_9EURO|nr:uncharacterized protein N7539_008997 [Penicillium diatomitis]KAJ5469379.1 hypothetical protein N7539_008997 [Penicillium diatomitis]